MDIDIDVLEDIARETGGYAKAHYSGRGMFGTTCAAVKLDTEKDLIVLGGAVMQYVEDENLQAVMLNNVRIDSMGYGFIVYWKTVTTTGAGDDYDIDDDDE